MKAAFWDSILAQAFIPKVLNAVQNFFFSCADNLLILGMILEGKSELIRSDDLD